MADDDIEFVHSDRSHEGRLHAMATAAVQAGASEGGFVVMPFSWMLWLTDEVTEDEWLAAVAAAHERLRIPPNPDAGIQVIMSLGGGWFRYYTKDGETVIEEDLELWRRIQAA